MAENNIVSNVTNSSTKFVLPKGISPESSVLIVISSFLCISGFIGNSIIAVVILKKKKMKTKTNWLVFNLAIADLLIVLISIPYNLINPYISWPFGYIGCKYLIMPTMEHFAGVCVLTHTAISLARYANIIRPSAEDILSNQVLKGAILIIWTISFLVLSAPLMGVVGNFVLKFTPSNKLDCRISWISERRKRTYRVLVFVLTYVIPMLITGYSPHC